MRLLLYPHFPVVPHWEVSHICVNGFLITVESYARQTESGEPRNSFGFRGVL